MWRRVEAFEGKYSGTCAVMRVEIGRYKDKVLVAPYSRPALTSYLSSTITFTTDFPRRPSGPRCSSRKLLGFLTTGLKRATLLSITGR